MTAVGFTCLVGQLYWDAALPYTVVGALASLELPITVHLFLAFPSGRLETRLERWFVQGMYAPGSSSCRSRCSSRIRATTAAPRARRTRFCVLDSDVAASVPGSRQRPGDIGLRGDRDPARPEAARASGATRRAIGLVLLTSAVAALGLVSMGIADAAGVQVEKTPLDWVGAAFLGHPGGVPGRAPADAAAAFWGGGSGGGAGFAAAARAGA